MDADVTKRTVSYVNLKNELSYFSSRNRFIWEQQRRTTKARQLQQNHRQTQERRLFYRERVGRTVLTKKPTGENWKSHVSRLPTG